MSEVDEGKPHLRSLFDGEIYELDGVMTIGRQAECNIVLDRELGASRKHARFTVVDHNVFVTDLGSLNGTLVNGKEIEGEAQLSNGDRLIFDVNEYEVVIPAQSSEPEIDPDRTVFVKRDRVRPQESSEPPVESIEDRNEVPAPPPEPAASPEPEPAASPEPEPAASLEPEPAASPEPEPAASPEPEPAASPEPEPAASPEPEPAASPKPEPAASPKPEPAASPKPEPAASPEPAAAAPTPKPAPQDPKPAEAVRRPGSWGISANVDNADGTVLAAGVVAVNVEAAQVDLSSISEPTIVVQSGENADTLLPLVGEQTEWSIGSSPDRDLRIKQSGVSGNHAAIVCEGSKWKVVDQMSINGTFVNGNRVNIRFINNDDILRFGPVECRFVVPAGFKGAGRSAKSSGASKSLWKIALPIAILLILGGVGYYAYTSGMFSPPVESTTTGTQ